MTGPYEDKENSETHSPAKSGEVKKPNKRGPKNKGKIMVTPNMIEIKKLIVCGVNKTTLIAVKLGGWKSATFKVLDRMYKIGMIERVNISKHNRKEYVYTINPDFRIHGKSEFKPIDGR